MQCRMCHRQRIFHSVVKKQLDQTQPHLNKMRYQQLRLPFLTRGCQSLFLCDDLLTSCVNVMCLIYPAYNALSDLEQFPQETRDLDISPGLQSRGSKLELLAKCPELRHKTATACMRGNLDLLHRCRGDALGTWCKLSESKVCQICCTHRACMLGKTGMFCLSESLHVPSIVYLGAKLLGN